jgi:hypothetical protein
MKKYEIRKEYFKLRIKGHSNNQCRKILLVPMGKTDERDQENLSKHRNSGRIH